MICAKQLSNLTRLTLAFLAMSVAAVNFFIDKVKSVCDSKEDKYRIWIFKIILIVLGCLLPFNLCWAKNRSSTFSEQYEFEKFLSLNIDSALAEILIGGSYLVQVKLDVLENSEKNRFQNRLALKKVPGFSSGTKDLPVSFIEAHLTEFQVNKMPKRSFRSNINKVHINISLDKKINSKNDEQIKKIVELVIESFVNKPYTISLVRASLTDKFSPNADRVIFLRQNQKLVSLIVFGLVFFVLCLYAIAQLSELRLKKLEVKVCQHSPLVGTGAIQANVSCDSLVAPISDVSVPESSLTDHDKYESVSVLFDPNRNDNPMLPNSGNQIDVNSFVKKTKEPEACEKNCRDVYCGAEWFKLLLATNSKYAGELVKSLVSANTSDAKAVLAVIPRVMSLELLSPIFQHLDELSLNQWREIVIEPIEDGAFERADQVLIMQSRKASGMHAPAVLKDGSVLTEIDMIPEFDLDLEAEVFSAIIEARDRSLLKKAGMKFFPAKLLDQLPEKIFGEVLAEWPLAERASILNFVSGSLKQIIRNTLPCSDNIGELLDLQTLQVDADENLKRRLDKSKHQVWGNFVYAVRHKIQSNESVYEAAEGILDQWITEVTKEGPQISQS